MARPYNVLRGLMRQYEITNESLGRELKISPVTVSKKLNGHSFWTSEEMWHVMALVEAPSYRLHEVFPRNGQNKRGKEEAV